MLISSRAVLAHHPAGRLIWISPTLPGSRHDIAAAREQGLLDVLDTAQRPEDELLAVWGPGRSGVVDAEVLESDGVDPLRTGVRDHEIYRSPEAGAQVPILPAGTALDLHI